jgi:signal transduction histidine kinase
LKKNIEDEKTIKLQSQKLQQVEQQKNILFTNIAHEFQTPLNIIQGLSKYIASSSQLSEDNYEALHILNKNSKSLSEATRQILAINSSVNDDTSSTKVWFSLLGLFEYILPEFLFLSKEKSITLDYSSLTNSSINIHSDLNKIIIIFQNLLSNAIKYTATNGTILIKCSDANQTYYEITIEDNGRGIPKEELPYIFDRYFQAGNEAEGGFGLGLAICQDYIKSLKGEISVMSTLGKGSTFLVQIPKVVSEKLPLPTELYSFPKSDFLKLKPLKYLT